MERGKRQTDKKKEASEKQPHPCKKQTRKGRPPKGVFAIGAIITLFVVMQMTGRIHWEEKFGPPLPRKSAFPE